MFELLGELCIELVVLLVVELEVDDVVLKLCDVSVVIVAVPCTSTLVSCTGSITDVVIVFDMTEFGFVGLIGLIGLTGLLIFVAVIMQVLDVSNQAVHVGEPYGSEHWEVLDSVIKPLYPV